MLETQAISKSFGRLTALSDVSFSVEQGEIFGIAGPNGAGKSTLFNVITGIYPPTAGKVFFQGHDITTHRPHEICQRGIGRTYQIPTTFHTMTIHDNIRVGSTFGSHHKRSPAEILDFLQLSGRASQPARNLDLYTTKLVMLGAVLATGCQLLMLDEPMAGLSIAEIDNFLSLIKSTQERWNTTIIIIEHLLDILIGITGRMMILHDGQLLYLGPSQDVTQDRRVVEVYLGARKEG